MFIPSLRVGNQSAPKDIIMHSIVPGSTQTPRKRYFLAGGPPLLSVVHMKLGRNNLVKGVPLAWVISMSCFL